MTRADKKVTPVWITMSQAAHGWSVSNSQARRIVAKEERRTKKRMRVGGKIRTADFLAIPRGDLAASPMIPEVPELFDKVEALSELVIRLMHRMARHEKRLARHP